MNDFLQKHLNILKAYSIFAQILKYVNICKYDEYETILSQRCSTKFVEI